jgi:enhancer of polycomb-like protein
MQTRKNRKNDEASYEKMLKIRRDLNKAVLLMEMVKNRESKKKELVVTTLKIFENRYHVSLIFLLVFCFEIQMVITENVSVR